MKAEVYLTKVSADKVGLGLFNYELLPDKKFIDVNLTLLNMLEYVCEVDFFKKRLGDLFVNSSDKNAFFEILLRNGQVKFFEAALKKSNGSVLWVAINASYILCEDGTEYLEGVFQNISHQKEIYERMALEKNFLQGLFDNIPDAVYFKDVNNRIVKVNKFYIEGTGLKEEEIVGKTDFDFFPYEQAKVMFKDDKYVLETGKPIIGKIEKTLLSSGLWNKVITTKIPMYDKNGEIIGTMGTTRDMTAYANIEEQRLNMVINTLDVLGKAMEMRDPYTFSHTRHVAKIAERIAKALGWDDNRLLAMKLAGELHDLGKMSIPLDILNKPGRLSKLESSLIQEHVKNCYDLIKDIDFPFPLAEITYQHHERLDGSGYPRQLKGNEILPEARILAVSDVFESMTHRRPYREALGIDKAFEELIDGEGTRYDKEVVKTLRNIVGEDKEINSLLSN